MTRPVPLAILSFLFGVLLVAMIAAPHLYTIEDAVFSNPEYADEIRVEAKIVANSELWSPFSTDGQDSANGRNATATANGRGTTAIADGQGTTAVANGRGAMVIVDGADGAVGDILANARTQGVSLVVSLQNTGNAAAWGKLYCRISHNNALIQVPVDFLTANMDKPVICVIPLDGALELQEDWLVKTRWAKLYTK